MYPKTHLKTSFSLTICASFLIMLSVNCSPKNTSFKQAVETTALHQEKDDIEIEVTTPHKKEIMRNLGHTQKKYAVKEITIRNFSENIITLDGSSLELPLIKAKRVSAAMHYDVLGRSLLAGVVAIPSIFFTLACWGSVAVTTNKNKETAAAGAISAGVCGLFGGILWTGTSVLAIDAARASTINKEIRAVIKEKTLDKKSVLTIEPGRSVTKYLFTHKKKLVQPFSFILTSADAKSTSFTIE